jgi:Mycothiol maleylpyruvate isomerase N-terminal domain
MLGMPRLCRVTDLTERPWSSLQGPVGASVGSTSHRADWVVDPAKLLSVTLCFAGDLGRRTVIHAAELVSGLVSRPEVAAAWTRESSCTGMTVGGLTRHLVSQPVIVVNLLGTDRTDGADAETIDLLEHYARAPWLNEDLDGEVNRAIRDASDRQASEGPEAALAGLARAREELDKALTKAPKTTYVPWQGWSLDTDDFLVTRLMEMVVHSDDLAASVDVTTPDFGPATLDPVIRLLGALAVRRHGQDALVRTLARPQRAPRTVSAF